MEKCIPLWMWNPLKRRNKLGWEEYYIWFDVKRVKYLWIKNYEIQDEIKIGKWDICVGFPGLIDILSSILLFVLF